MKKTILLIVFISMAVLLTASLVRRPAADSPPGAGGCNFYYWKTQLSFDEADKALADSLGLKRLHLRYFDVDWSPSLNMPVPVGELSFQSIWDGGEIAQLGDYQVIPTVYLVNRVFEKNLNTDSLAAKISKKIENMNRDLASQTYHWGGNLRNAEAPAYWNMPDSLQPDILFRSRITEIQLDCDWTPTTRDRYFQFLRAMKKANPDKAITCTVRLHQFRDGEKAGIPPVDRGTLMCYNVAPPKEPSTTDAIFDAELVQGYLKGGDYPLALDAVLPLFSWGALFHENQFKGLAAGLSESSVKGNPLFAPVSEGKYRFTQDTVFTGVYMREGDVVRLDEPSPAEVSDLAERLTKVKAVRSIAFFDWNPSKIREYHVQDICKKFQAAR